MDCWRIFHFFFFFSKSESEVFSDRNWQFKREGGTEVAGEYGEEE